MAMTSPYQKWILSGIFMLVITLIYQLTITFQQISPDMDVNWLQGFDVLLPYYAAISFSYAYHLWSRKGDSRVPAFLIIVSVGAIILLVIFHDFLISMFMPRIIAWYFLTLDVMAVFLGGILIPAFQKHEWRKEKRTATQI